MVSLFALQGAVKLQVTCESHNQCSKSNNCGRGVGDLQGRLSDVITADMIFCFTTKRLIELEVEEGCPKRIN